MSDGKDLRNRVAAALRAGRTARKLTQEDLAAEAGCSVETLSNAERGVSLPGLELFLQFASILDLDIAALVRPAPRTVSKARSRLEAEAHHVALSLSDERLKLWLETGKLFGRS